MSLKAARKKLGDIKLAKIDDFMDEIDLKQPVIDKTREIEQESSGPTLISFLNMIFNEKQRKSSRRDPGQL